MGKRPDSATPERSISIACKVPSEELETLVHATCDINEVGSYILDYRIGLEGLKEAVALIRDCNPQKQVVFDPRDANFHSLEVGRYAPMAQAAGADAVILFLPRHPAQQRRSIKCAQAAGLRLIVSPEPREDMHMPNDELEPTLAQAIQLGIKDFWLRGTPPDRVARYTKCLRNLRYETKDFEFYIARQFDKRGKLLNAAAIAMLCDKTYHLVVGRAICSTLEAESGSDPREVTKGIAREFINGNS